MPAEPFRHWQSNRMAVIHGCASQLNMSNMHVGLTASELNAAVQAPRTPERQPGSALQPEDQGSFDRNCQVVASLADALQTEPEAAEAAARLLGGCQKSRHLLLLALVHCCVSGWLHCCMKAHVQMH